MIKQNDFELVFDNDDVDYYDAGIADGHGTLDAGAFYKNGRSQWMLYLPKGNPFPWLADNPRFYDYTAVYKINLGCDKQAAIDKLNKLLTNYINQYHPKMLSDFKLEMVFHK